MKNKKEIIINGFPLALVGGFILFVDLFLIIAHGLTTITVLLAIAGILLISIYESILIDYDKKRIRIRTNILFFITGKWHPLSKFDTLELYPNQQSSRLVGMMTIIPKDMTKNSYEIYLTNSITPQKKVLLRKYKSIPNAQKELKIYCEKLEMKKVDHIMINWNKNRNTTRRK